MNLKWCSKFDYLHFLSKDVCLIHNVFLRWKLFWWCIALNFFNSNNLIKIHGLSSKHPLDHWTCLRRHRYILQTNLLPGPWFHAGRLHYLFFSSIRTSQFRIHVQDVQYWFRQEKLWTSFNRIHLDTRRTVDGSCDNDKKFILWRIGMLLLELQSVL